MFSLFFTDGDRLRRAAADRMQQAFRPGTRANQKSHVLLFVAFALHFGLQDFPADTSTLLSFGEFLLRTYRAPGSVTNALSAVRGFHLFRGFSTSGCDDVRLALFKRALPLTVRHTPAPAPPVSLGLLERLCTRAMECGSMGAVFAAFISVLFFSVTRASSLVPLTSDRFDTTRWPTWGDVREREGGLLLRIKWGKCRQSTEEGFWVPLSRLRDSQACPVQNLDRLRARWGSVDSGVPLFAWPRVGGSSARGGGSLTLRLARQWLGLFLRGLGEGGRGLSLHSFRRGAATLAFTNGAELDDVRQLGGWKSDAVTRYIPALEARKRAASHLHA